MKYMNYLFACVALSTSLQAENPLRIGPTPVTPLSDTTEAAAKVDQAIDLVDCLAEKHEPARDPNDQLPTGPYGEMSDYLRDLQAQGKIYEVNDTAHGDGRNVDGTHGEDPNDPEGGPAIAVDASDPAETTEGLAAALMHEAGHAKSAEEAESSTDPNTDPGGQIGTPTEQAVNATFNHIELICEDLENLCKMADDNDAPPPCADVLCSDIEQQITGAMALWRSLLTQVQFGDMGLTETRLECLRFLSALGKDLSNGGKYCDCNDGSGSQEE